MNLQTLISRFESSNPGVANALARAPAASTVRRVVWTLAFVSLLAWSLLAYGAHALLVGSASFLQSQLDWLGAYAWLQPWLQSGIGLTEGLSVGITWIVWGLGALTILLGAWLLPKAFTMFGAAAAR